MDTRQHSRQAKQWKDLSRGEKALIIATPFIFVILLGIAFHGSGQDTSTPSNNQSQLTGNQTTQASDTSSAQSSQPSVAQQVAAWYSKYGYILHTFGNDASKTSTDAQSGDVAQVGADCGQLQTDIKTAQSFPAIPDPQTASDFSGALSYYADGAQDCIDGATNYDASLISKAAQEISHGNAQLGVAADDIQKLATN